MSRTSERSADVCGKRGESGKSPATTPNGTAHSKGIFESRNGNVDIQFWNSTARFELPDFGHAELVVKRTSKIKVRQYGSKFHLDKHENFAARWDALRMDRAIADLWAPRDMGWGIPDPPIDVRLLLFIGFDKAVRPFERELNELKPHQTRAAHGIEFFERTWDDAMGRGFGIKAALWAHCLE